MIRILDTKEAMESLCRALDKLKIEYTVSHERLAYYHYANLKYPMNAPHIKSLNNFVECYIVQFQREKEV